MIDANLLKGHVLWFDVKKGFGFIRSNDQDIFVHFSKIESPPGEFRVLEEGEEVSFELFYAERGNGSKKPQAKNVKRLKGENDGTTVSGDNELNNIGGQFNGPEGVQV
jgi:CspA family cold shock protein